MPESLVLKFHEDVADDLESGYQFYEEADPGTGLYFERSILQDAYRLQASKQSYRSRHFGFYRLLGSVFPFGIYYDFIEESVVMVFAILPMKADPDWIKDQLGYRR